MIFRREYNPPQIQAIYRTNSTVVPTIHGWNYNPPYFIDEERALSVAMLEQARRAIDIRFYNTQINPPRVEEDNE